MKRAALVLLAVSIAVISAWAFAQTLTSGLTPQEKRGKRIFLRGANSAGKEITALLGDPPMEVPGSLMACANCHGYDGRGKPEGGVTPSDITWEALTKPYGIVHQSGRKHPAYNEALIARAVQSGRDPAGNPLHKTMPRFRLAQDELNDLIAYLKRVGKDLDPGLTDTAVAIGTLVPQSGPLAAVGDAIRSVLTAYFDDINRQGGIYSRKIELHVSHTGSSPEESRKALGRLLDQEGIFGMAGAFIAGADKELAAMLQEKEVPLIGPTSLYGPVESSLNREIFYLMSGVNEQARALVEFAAGSLKLADPIAGIVRSQGEATAAAAKAIEEQCRSRGWKNVRQVSYSAQSWNAAALAKELRSENTRLIFFLGDGSNEVELAREAGRLDWRPHILLPGALAGRQILETPSVFKGHVYASFSVLPNDPVQGDAAQFRQFAEQHGINQDHLATKISAYCAAKILVEGLKLAGRDLTREKLITALEGLYKYETGVMPPLTFGPNRRVGALGAYIMKLDTEKRDLVPAGGWVQLN